MHSIICLSLFWLLVSFLVVETKLPTELSEPHQLGSTVSLSPTPANPGQETQRIEEPVRTIEKSRHLWQNVDRNKVLQPSAVTSSNSIRLMGIVIEPQNNVQHVRNIHSSIPNFSQYGLISNVEPRHPSGSSTSHPNKQTKSSVKRLDAVAAKLRAQPKIAKKSSDKLIQKPRNHYKQIKFISEFETKYPPNPWVITRATTGDMPIANEIAWTDVGEKTTDCTVLLPHCLLYQASRRNWIQPSAKMKHSVPFAYNSIYVHVDVLGTKIMKNFQVMHDQQRLDKKVELTNYRENLVEHTIRAVVSYIYTINRLSEAPLYECDEDISMALNRAVLDLKEFLKTCQLTSKRESGNEAHPIDPSVAISDAKRAIQKVFDGTNYTARHSNRIGIICFLRWLEVEHKDLHEKMTQRNEPYKAKNFLLSFINEYIMTSMGTAHLLKEISNISIVGSWGCPKDQGVFLICRLLAPFKINWK